MQKNNIFVNLPMISLANQIKKKANIKIKNLTLIISQKEKINLKISQ